GPYTVTALDPRPATVILGGVSQAGTVARTFVIGFPTQVLSGTYSFVFGQDTTNPNKITNYVTDIDGNQIDNNFNAGLSVLRGADPTNFQFATVTAQSGTLANNN